MDKRIETNLVLGLTRIFSAYGWSGEGAPEHFADKISTIEYGLLHGDALGYSTHLKMLIQAREKDGQWKPFTSLFVNGISASLESYANHNDLFTIEPPKHKKEFKTPISMENVFDSAAHGAIKRLRLYGTTVIRYTLVEEYGAERLLQDLRKYFPKATLRIELDEHVPDQLRDWIYDDGWHKTTIYIPIMPLVVITDGRKR